MCIIIYSESGIKVFIKGFLDDDSMYRAYSNALQSKL